LDFISRVVGAVEEKVCSFCDRQLKNLEGAGEPTEAQLRWLDAVIQKEVPVRSAGVLTALKAMNGKYQKAEVQSQPTQGNTAAQKFQPVPQRQVPALASPVSGSRDEQIEELTNKVNATMTAEDVQIQIQNEVAKGTTKVITSTGFKFDDTGLTVSKSGSEMETTITEDGMTVYRSGKEVLTANNTGVDATNLRATTYLVIGKNSRFEDYGSNRTGCFWIGG
jgi:hypothetical protein